VTTTPADPRRLERSTPGNERRPEQVEVAAEMIARRREKLTLDALTDLVLWLRGVREERKAVLAVSDGWRLFGPNNGLLTRGKGEDPPPGPGGIGVAPGGQLTTDLARDRYGDPRLRCEADRLQLSQLDNGQTFRDLLDRANRSNVSFYPIDSRGLPVFDTSIEENFVYPGGARGPVPPAIDQARLRLRIDSLQTLAEATDGMAVVNSNDIERGLTRIVADLTTYYLLGYYSTNAKLDGKFRSIKVRVKRPGVDVRARRGYLAASEEEVSRGTPAAAVATAVPVGALERALGGLAALRPDTRVRTHVAWLPAGEGREGGRVWAVAELDRTLARSPEWAGGARVEATLAGSDGSKLASTTLALAPGVRSLPIELDGVALPQGEAVLRLRLVPTGGGLALMETVRFTVPASVAGVGAPRLWRRGPITGPQFVATGDAAFRRNEHLRVEVPASGPIDAVTAELLDRTGRVLPIPVAARTSTPSGGVSWGTAELALAPLAAGDYALKITVTTGGATQEALTAFRVIP
jgi:VWFA-related protein